MDDSCSRCALLLIAAAAAAALPPAAARVQSLPAQHLGMAIEIH
jgi:hypothetical protein